MATAVIDKLINWQAPSVDDNEISVEDYRAMVDKAENSGYMSYETHRRKFNEWFNEISNQEYEQMKSAFLNSSKRSMSQHISKFLE